ncbi:hypothetical protein [Pectinatus sottacetonis]|uniref:hypothetical protein n=1 Tax=Pectinatus sottacetonis TaxID=1002795 RepID=UPI0018C525DF|nr:hypothetical protein [Pectinatus sottacetonis]
MVPRIERIARTNKIVMNYGYKQFEMHDREFKENKKKKSPNFKKVLNKMIDKSHSAPYTVEINEKKFL